jgi:hypothetical protein
VRAHCFLEIGIQPAFAVAAAEDALSIFSEKAPANAGAFFYTAPVVDPLEQMDTVPIFPLVTGASAR